MENRLLTIYLLEVSKQCKFCTLAAANIDSALKNLSDREASTWLWYNVQNLLISAANISKILWGNKKTEELRKDLRDLLKIKDDSPLRSRDLRNHFEHFDDRISTWYQTSKNKNYIDTNIGPSNFIGGFDESDFMRNYNTDENSVNFKGEKYYIQPLIEEVINIAKTANIEHERLNQL